ncbi:MAG: hypothetical protein HYX37_18255 [Rhizobiales bacterium]|nr:hypothetical protein [Hyphomicrobiales bacterium]
MFAVRTIVAAIILSALAGPALADAIDGNWCHSDGRRFSIRGPEIVTPGGKQMEGQYSRHWFNYTVPAPEAGAGETIFMTLANENTVHLRRGEQASGNPQETWVRCAPSISALPALPRS